MFQKIVSLLKYTMIMYLNSIYNFVFNHIFVSIALGKLQKKLIPKYKHFDHGNNNCKRRNPLHKCTKIKLSLPI